MTITHLTVEQVEKLANSVWYAKKDKAVRSGDEKHAAIYHFGLSGQKTEFPFRSDEWVTVGKYSVRIQYQMWDIPTTIFVRKTVNN